MQSSGIVAMRGPKGRRRRKIARSFIGLPIATMVVTCVWAQGAPHDGPIKQRADASVDQLQDSEQRLGPFELKGQRITVVLHKKRVPGGTDPDTQETLSRLEIQDSDGAVRYDRSFAYQLASDQFDTTMNVTVQPLHGTLGDGLLFSFGELPSTPLGGVSWQVFGFLNHTLVPFSKPINSEGQLITDSRDGNTINTSKEPNFQPDVLRLRIWSGNFFVIVPLRVDWQWAKMNLAWRCGSITPTDLHPVCQYAVEANRVPSTEKMTFVRLFPEAEEGFVPAHVVVRKGSTVDFLAVAAEVVWNERPDSVDITLGEDPWIKVRIDGKEGWLHTQEDFQAIGLPMSG